MSDVIVILRQPPYGIDPVRTYVDAEADLVFIGTTPPGGVLTVYRGHDVHRFPLDAVLSWTETPSMRPTPPPDLMAEARRAR